MARPRTHIEDRIATAVRLPESVHRRLHEAARARQVSANLLVTSAISEYLDRLTPLEDLFAADERANRGARP